MQGSHSNFRAFLLICVNGSCLGFVIWQSMKCINTYIEKPVGTRLKAEKSTDLPFPSITVCGREKDIMDYHREWSDGLMVKVFNFHYYDTYYLENTCDIRYINHEIIVM